jgi:hypothetical protein
MQWRSSSADSFTRRGNVKEVRAEAHEFDSQTLQTIKQASQSKPSESQGRQAAPAEQGDA